MNGNVKRRFTCITYLFFSRTSVEARVRLGTPFAFLRFLFSLRKRGRQGEMPLLKSSSSCESLSPSSTIRLNVDAYRSLRAEDVAAHLQLLYSDAEAGANRCLNRRELLKQTSRLLIGVAVASLAACAPLVTWQLRHEDRVWRMRHPVRVRNHKFCIGLLGGVAATSVMLLTGPWLGITSTMQTLDTRRRDLDAAGWKALVLKSQMTTNRNTRLVGMMDSDDYAVKLRDLEETVDALLDAANG